MSMMDRLYVNCSRLLTFFIFFHHVPAPMDNIRLMVGDRIECCWSKRDYQRYPVHTVL
jgi:hypothetical protein